MAKHDHDDDNENISIIPKPEGHLGAHKEKKGTDSKSLIMQVISEIEEHDLVFTREEIIRHAKDHKIPAPEADAVIDDLIKSNYLKYAHGTQGLLTRSAWRDYGGIDEETPEF
ncbi:TPA: hypothetical protein H1012_03145 [archaeon]|nr:hypothetical protein [Candidatus Naiadarchaeales archaeon SRR2090159.bin1288]